MRNGQQGGHCWNYFRRRSQPLSWKSDRKLFRDKNVSNCVGVGSSETVMRLVRGGLLAVKQFAIAEVGQ